MNVISCMPPRIQYDQSNKELVQFNKFSLLKLFLIDLAHIITLILTVFNTGSVT